MFYSTIIDISSKGRLGKSKIYKLKVDHRQRVETVHWKKNLCLFFTFLLLLSTRHSLEPRLAQGVEVSLQVCWIFERKQLGALGSRA